MDTYYRPYAESDSEYSDSESYSSSFSRDSRVSRPDNANPDYIDPRIPSPDFASLANALMAPISMTSGPTFSTIAQEDRYSTRRLDPRTTYGPYVAPPDVNFSTERESGVKQTVVMLQSRDRDKGVFPQPTNCHLFLPRVYKSISGFSIAQINLTSAFFYFSKAKQNINIELYEKDRILYGLNSKPSLDTTGNPIQLRVLNVLREGSYNINQLLSEMQIQLNTTPLFYDFLNGFSDFLSQFVVNGDYSINFNYPGDYYYDAVRKIFIPNPTRSQIVNFYFQSQYANKFFYNNQECIIAYYYPVLKEAILDPTTDLTTYNFSGTSFGTDISGTISYLIYSFEGIDDPLAAIVINNNISVLDQYRLYHTFRYSLVNKYVCSYDVTNNRVTIQSPSLNTSLVNLLNTKYQSYISQILNKNSITAEYYNNLANSNTQLLSVVQSMYDYMQTSFAKYFAVNYNSYTLPYYANSNNTVFIRNGLDASGISFVYTTSNTPLNEDITSLFRENPPYIWPRMSNLGNTEGALRNMGNPDNPYPQSSNFAYDLYGLSNINTSKTFIDSNYNIYTNRQINAGDILTNVDAGKYTIFQFRSKYRQTLQVESLPRQTNWRYPIWNKNPDHGVETPIETLFDTQYTYKFPDNVTANISTSHILPYDISYNSIYGWSNLSNTSSNYNFTYTDSSNLWNGYTETISVPNSNGRFYMFQTPLPVPYADKGDNEYKYNFNVTFSSSDIGGFPSDLYAFFYHDIAAFAADLKFARNESPIHYKQKLLISSNTLSNTYSFRTFANQQYYILLRPLNITPSLTKYQIIPWFSGTGFDTIVNTSNFDNTADPNTPAMLSNLAVAQAADPDYIRMPIQSTLWGAEPPNELVNIPLDSASVPIGYDTNGISTDLTDYIPFLSNAHYPPVPKNPFSSAVTLFVDPQNNFVFQSNSPYKEDTDSYIYDGGLNAILSNGKTPYTPTSVSYRNYKIANYNATTYIQDIGTLDYTPTDITQYISPYNLTTTGGLIPGYSSNYTGVNSNLFLGAGVCGFTFLPGSGTWDIDSIMFKTNFITTSSNNTKIHALGIFPTESICFKPISYINLSNAVGICLNTHNTIYSTDPDANNLILGFDPNGGTYHYFSNYKSLVVNSNTPISGFTQNSKALIPDSNVYYSVIPFYFSDYSNWNIATVDIELLKTKIADGSLSASVKNIRNLTGSPIAYPYANTPFVSTVFYDGQYLPNGKGVVLSSSNTNIEEFSPPVGIDESVSVYQQSLPWVNTQIHFQEQSDIINNPDGFSPYSDIPSVASYIYPSIKNYMMFQGNSFAITKYTSYTEVIPPPGLPDLSLKLLGHLPADLIYPDNENTSLIGVTGNSSNYVFLGASNINGNISQLRFKVYDPVIGTLNELPTNPYYTFSNSLQLQHFVFNDLNAWFISAADIPANKVVLQGDTAYVSTITTSTRLSYTFSNRLFSELQMDPAGAFVYFTNSLEPGFSNLRMYSLNSTNPGYIRNSSGYNITLETGGSSSLPPNYTQLAVTLNGVEEIILTNISFSPYRFYKVNSFFPGTSLSSSNTKLSISQQVLPSIPKRLYGGANGSKWMTFDTMPLLMGNRNDAVDSPVSINTAWQIMFPTVKIVMKQLTTGVSPIINLQNITYPEYPHSAMFAYSGYSNLMKDIGKDSGSWGNENRSNFMVSDISFNGFEFNSYLMDVPLLPNYTNGDSNTDYYLAIRGWLPTENFQTMLRFYLPNRYDFGFTRFLDISNEVVLASTNPQEFNPTYLKCLNQFNSNFIFSNTVFGSNANINFAGVSVSSINYGDFLKKYYQYFSTVSTQSYMLSNIQSTLKGNIDTFIITDLQYILPSSALKRQRYTDPLLFQVLFKSQLDKEHLSLDDEWGLGWNLGFPKQDTDFATVHTGSSFYKIQDDFIYLRLNPEFNINRMDSGGKENYKSTREPSGITNQYYCKLLLTSFGGNATTFIHNPITFNPILYRLSKLEFQWIDKNGNIINNSDAEWDMVVNFNEEYSNMKIKDKIEYVPMDPSFISSFFHTEDE